jgi:hypothetical protein
MEALKLTALPGWLLVWVSPPPWCSGQDLIVDASREAARQIATFCCDQEYNEKNN